MPKAGAFDKAKVKKSGGFGASKGDRFGGPKESCESTPSSTAYSADLNSIGAKARKSASKIGDRGGGFGSSEKRGAPMFGQSSDSPGPGAYAEAANLKASFGQKKSAATSVSSFGATRDRFARDPGTYTSGPVDAPFYVPEGVGTVKPTNHAARPVGFGGASRFEKPPEVVQTDYDVPDSIASRAARARLERARSRGAFGSTVARGSAISGQRSDAPGPGAYDSKQSAFKTGAAPSSAFASGSAQHASNPSESNVTAGPAPGAYHSAHDKYSSKSFNAASLGVTTAAVMPGFGSAEKRGMPMFGQSSDAPGPGAYNTGFAGAEKSSVSTPSAVFASGTAKGVPLLPSYGETTLMSADMMGIGSVMGNGNIKGTFGGAPRFLDENAVMTG